MFYKLQINCIFYPEIVKHLKTLLFGVIYYGGDGFFVWEIFLVGFVGFFLLGYFVLTV